VNGRKLGRHQVYAHTLTSALKIPTIVYILEHVVEPEVKRPLGRRRCKWEDKVKMDLRNIVLGGFDWIHLVQNV
jgi:hypothetical protein